ncbi:unnamed protein product [Ceratitis capitata]|uniref:(Mediterranean fruit fly) hypothetical protein n=1 Tax=Ceratitis capitata TaxID=7213 RepID=A0A811UZS3_CERCA|nr:unnamed protein product [Ceratitis capitata]
MSKPTVIEITPEEMIDPTPEATLGYMLYEHRMKLKAGGEEVNHCLSLSQSKLFITNRLISKTEMNISTTEFEDLRTLVKQRKFCTYLKSVILRLLIWKKMTPAQQEQIFQKIEREKAEQQAAQVEGISTTSGKVQL